jgi:uncharacterized protein (UPF0333 family)
MDNPKVKAQASLEFVITFVMLVLFVVLVAKMFAWFGARIIHRQEAYELSRNATVGSAAANSNVNFFQAGNGKTPMNLFNESP